MPTAEAAVMYPRDSDEGYVCWLWGRLKGVSFFTGQLKVYNAWSFVVTDRLQFLTIFADGEVMNFPQILLIKSVCYMWCEQWYKVNL